MPGEEKPLPPDRAADAPPLSDRAAGAGAEGSATPDSGPRAPAHLAAQHPSPDAAARGAARPPVPVPAAGGAAPAWRSPGITVLLTVVLVGGYLLLQAVVGLLVLVPVAAGELTSGGLPTPDHLIGLVWDHAGLTAWLGIAVATPPALAALWWLARRQGPGPARRRLALVWPRRRDALAWLLAVLAFGWLYERVVVWVDRPPLPPVMEQVFSTAGWVPALVVAVVVLAPAFEELAFRGFCLGGLAPLGPAWAIGLSSALFAVIHVQYDLFDVGAVLALGLLFGAARWQSGSTLLTLGLHAFHNALASLEALWIVGEVGP